MKQKQLSANNGIEAIWVLLGTSNKYFRAAGILLLQEYCKTLVASGKGALASELLQRFRDADPRRGLRPRGKENVLVP